MVSKLTVFMAPRVLARGCAEAQARRPTVPSPGRRPASVDAPLARNDRARRGTGGLAKSRARAFSLRAARHRSQNSTTGGLGMIARALVLGWLVWSLVSAGSGLAAVDATGRWRLDFGGL